MMDERLRRDLARLHPDLYMRYIKTYGLASDLSQEPAPKITPDNIAKTTFGSAAIVLTGASYSKRNSQARRCVKLLSAHGYKLASNIPIDPECIELSATGTCRVQTNVPKLDDVEHWLNISDLGTNVYTNRLKLIYILTALLPVMFVLGFLLG